ncbi:MAG: DUF2314 domain-containing protein [Pseudomonadota bacterium]
MSAAIAEARQHLDRVLEIAIDEDGNGHPALGLKVSFPTQGSELKSEVIWMNKVVRLSDNRFTAHLNNDPVDLGDLAYGDKLPFEHDQIMDWALFVEEGTIYGHFTTRLIIVDLPRSEARNILKAIGTEALPDNW